MEGTKLRGMQAASTGRALSPADSQPETGTPVPGPTNNLNDAESILFPRSRPGQHLDISLGKP